MKMVKGFDMTDPMDYMNASMLQLIGGYLKSLREFVDGRWDEEQVLALQGMCDAYDSLMDSVKEDVEDEHEVPYQVYNAYTNQRLRRG